MLDDHVHVMVFLLDFLVQEILKLGLVEFLTKVVVTEYRQIEVNSVWDSLGPEVFVEL